MGNNPSKDEQTKAEKKKKKKHRKTSDVAAVATTITTPTPSDDGKQLQEAKKVTPATQPQPQPQPQPQLPPASVGPPDFYTRISRLFRVRLGDVSREEEDEDERVVLEILSKTPLADNRIDWVDMDKECMTALHWSSYFGSHQVTKRLLELKADVNKQNLLGFTPLLFAARSGRELCGAILIEGGANIDIKDNNGNGVGQWGNMRFFDALLMARFRHILDDLEVHISGPQYAHLRDIILDFIGSQEFDIDTSPPKGYGYELQQYEDD